MNPGAHHHFLAIFGHVNVLHLADLDILVADLGLVRLQVLGIVKAYFVIVAFRELLLDPDEAARQHDHHRQHPNQRQTRPSGTAGHGVGQIVRAGILRFGHRGASHKSRSSKVRAASRVNTTTAPKAHAPQPTMIEANDWTCTKVASSEMAYISSIDHRPMNYTSRNNALRCKRWRGDCAQ